MAKIKKFFGRTVGVFLEWILIFVILFSFLIRTSSFQSYLAKKATQFLSKEWRTEVTIGKVDISLFNRVYLENVAIKDLKGKQLLSIESLEVLVHSFGVHHLDIKEVVLNRGSVWIYKENPNGKMNFQFISDYFSSEDTTTTSSKFRVRLSSISLNETALRYDDFRVKHSDNGLDFNHINLNEVNAKVSRFLNEGPTTNLKINEFSIKDKSGLWVKSLSGDLKIDDKGVKMSSVHIKLNRSDLYASEIGYSYTNPMDLDDFNNKVKFNIVIKPSKVSLADVAFFVPELKGMNETITLSGTLFNVVNHFKIKNLDLRIRNNTVIQADLDLPDFSDFSAYRFYERIKHAQLDMNELSKIVMPGGKSLDLGAEVERLGLVSFNNMQVKGINGKLNLSPVKITSGKGALYIKSALQFDVLNDNIAIRSMRPDSVALRLSNFQLGEIIANSNLGIIDGDLVFASFELINEGYRLIGGKGILNRLGANGYEYHQTSLKSLSIEGQKLTANVILNDPNAKAHVSGEFNIDGLPMYNVSIDAEEVNLDKLGLLNEEDTKISGSILVNTNGKSFSQFDGEIKLNKLLFSQGQQGINVSEAKINFNHSIEEEMLKLRSSLADLDFIGKIDPNTIKDDILYEVSRVFPSIVQANKPKKGSVNNEFDAKLVVKSLDELTSLFIPGLRVDPQTELVLKFNAENDIFGIQMLSNKITYDSIIMEGIDLQQRVNSTGITANLLINELELGDSLIFHQINFVNTGISGKLNSSLGWDKGMLNDSRIQWKTNLLGSTDYELSFEKSRISINGVKWFISAGSDLRFLNNQIETNQLLLYNDREDQKIIAKGSLSNNVSDVLDVQITNFDLGDLTKMLNLDLALSGRVTGAVGLSNPFKGLTITSNFNVGSFYINQEEVGDIHLESTYDDKSSMVNLNGTLAYRGMKTLDFSGNYNTAAVVENLTLRLDFQQTDISFTNAFMDPDVLNNIEGKLYGFINVKGTPDIPRLSGKLQLKDAAADFTLLGCRYTMNGAIKVEQDVFEIDKLPIRDSEGNIASIDGTVYHSNFSKFNYNVDVDFEEDYHHLLSNKPNGKIDKFMLLNTKYKEGEVYYGKAYGRGTANISGYGSNMYITVNAQTRKGTKMVFPMYGTTQYEEESIIHFVNNGNNSQEDKGKIDFTGVNLDLNFDITSDAEVRLVFNEQTHDEIQAKTEGKLNLNLDAYNQMRLDGGLQILPGSVYNFTMGPARKPFEIIDGVINWSGDVYNADMKIVTSYLVRNANMLELTPEQDDKSLSKQDAQCLLNLTGTLIKPVIGFELTAPKAPESGKVLMNRINEDKDELNRQFFSLMLLGKFQPLRGINSANESAAIDLFENQINQALSQLSKSYNVKMDLGASNVSTSVQKSILNDRLIITGNFGVQNNTGSSSATGGFVGDVSVEYLVNESGTFRVNAFNRSNSNTVKENTGPFTQGAGLSYHEDFNSRKDFILLQSFLDIFRAKENKIEKLKRKKRQTKVPPVGTLNDPVESIDKKDEDE